MGNDNFTTAQGNLVLVNTFGNDNVNEVFGADDPEASPFAPNLSMSNVFGNGNTVCSEGNTNLNNTIGDRNNVDVKGNGNVTTVLGSDNQKVKKYYDHEYNEVVVKKPGVKVEGDGNLTTVVSNGAKVKVKGDSNVTSTFGDKVKAKIKGNSNISTAIGERAKVKSKGNSNITSAFGKKAKAKSTGDNQRLHCSRRRPEGPQRVQQRQLVVPPGRGGEVFSTRTPRPFQSPTHTRRNTHEKDTHSQHRRHRRCADPGPGSRCGHACR